MSSPSLRARARAAWRTIWSRLRRLGWRLLRALMVGAAALGPGTPPPPPPPPPPTEQVDERGADPGER